MRFSNISGNIETRINKLKQYLSHPRALSHNEHYDELGQLNQINFYTIPILKPLPMVQKILFDELSIAGDFTNEHMENCNNALDYEPSTIQEIIVWGHRSIASDYIGSPLAIYDDLRRDFKIGEFDEWHKEQSEKYLAKITKPSV